MTTPETQEEWKYTFEDIDLKNSPDKNPNFADAKKGFSVIEWKLPPKKTGEKLSIDDIDTAFSKTISAEVAKAWYSPNADKVKELWNKIDQEIRKESDPRKKLEKISLLAEELDIAASTTKWEQNQWNIQFQKRQTEIDTLKNKTLEETIKEFKKLISDSEWVEQKKRQGSARYIQAKWDESQWSKNPEAREKYIAQLEKDWPVG